jgi:peptidoglycan/xylan/chitin deacetylase (PgdA/CDA1 family)
VPPSSSGAKEPANAPPQVPTRVGDRNGAGDVVSGPRTGSQVAFTFHGAGSAADTTAVLSELAANDVRVSVFGVGSWLQAEPALARAVLDGGHELGNHTYHHLAMTGLASAQARSEVARCAAVLRQLTGTVGPWFRPSGTSESNATIRSAAHQSGYPVCVSYDVDSLDWTDPGAAAVTSTVLRLVRPGSIISMHLGHAGTVAALPAIMSGLASRSLQPVTLGTMLL